MKVRLIRVTQDPEELIQFAAAICTGTEDHPAKQAMLTAIESGHLSITEHTSFTFYVEGVSRALLAQITRHRIASFSVQSQRYVNMQEMPVVTPPTIQDDPQTLAEYKKIMRDIRDFYHRAISRGIPKEDARFATPQATCTKLLMTMNARELNNFLALRECNKAQWEIRQLASLILGICKSRMPNVFIRAGAPCRYGNCPEKRPCEQGPKNRKEVPANVHGV